VRRHLAGDLVDVVAVHELGRDGQGDQLAPAFVVLLSVAQLERERRGFKERKQGDEDEVGWRRFLRRSGASGSSSLVGCPACHRSCGSYPSACGRPPDTDAVEVKEGVLLDYT